MNLEKVIAKSLLKINALKLEPKNPFTWASGLLSPIYCDNRITLSYPEVRSLIKEGFAEYVKTFDKVDGISAVATAGIAHGALLADFLDLPFSYVRSKPKSHGKQNQIEGYIKPNSNLIVIEDLISTGKSSLEAVDCLKENGHNVLSVAAIFSYGLSIAEENFKVANCNYYSLSNFDCLVETYKELFSMDDQSYEMLSTWKKDPNKWDKEFRVNLLP